MDLIEAVGWIGSAILVVSLLQTKVLQLRLINLIGCIVLIGYNGVLQVWPMVGLNIVLAAINIFYLWRMLRSRHDPAEYTVIEVDPGDRYLQHVLRLHAADIAAYNPAFTGTQEGDLAFLILTGDETVGVVLARDAGGETAEIVLDWVTKRRRDLSPGEFVFRSSGVFTDHGFARVLSPAGMRDPYYARIGFTRQEDRWVLALA